MLPAFFDGSVVFFLLLLICIRLYFVILYWNIPKVRVFNQWQEWLLFLFVSILWTGSSIGWLLGYWDIEMHVSVFIRVIGVLLLAGGSILFGWTHQVLGRFWSPILEIAHAHKLVTWGPYRLVRHPMYSSLILFSLGIGLTAADMIMAISWVLGIFILCMLRIEKEEKLMIETFGNEYVAYKSYTGKLFPAYSRLFTNRQKDFHNNKYLH
jgi:protein-S-isoprenylcysteine O-methyltransferase Ste14